MLSAIVVAVTLAAVSPVASQDAEPSKEEIEATIGALQTQAAELDTDNVSTPTVGAVWNTNTAAGDGFDVLTPASANTVDVIAVGKYDGLRLPFVVHNNTETIASLVSVTGTVLDEAGALFATGGDNGIDPGWIEPKGIGIGYLYFDGVKFPAGATVEMVVDYEAAESRDRVGDLEARVVEWNHIENRVVGFLLNPHSININGPILVSVACLNEDGSVASSSNEEFTDMDTIPAGEQIPFQVILDPSSCDYILVVADGYRI